ncbi:MAG: hypothetical protein Q7S37_02250 [bacterium]|nr:hypothetical protein [bacterium]
MDKQNSIKNRPDWHIDAKWACVLFLIPIFTITFLIFNLYMVTKKDNAIKIVTTLTSAMYAPGDKSQDIEKVRALIKESPDKNFKPFPGMDIVITEQDLNKYNSGELKQKLFSQLAENIYKYDANKNSQSTVKHRNAFSDLGFMALLTKQGHDALGRYLLIPAIATLLLLSLTLFFSAGFGKAITAGLIFIIVGFIPTIILFIQGNASISSADTSQMSVTQGVSSIMRQIGPLLSQIMLKNYLTLLIGGLFLLIFGFIARQIQKRKFHKTPAA